VQNVADVVALDLVRRLDGRTHDQILTDTSPVGFSATLISSRNRNDFADTGAQHLVVTLGKVTSGTFTPDANGSAVPTAVKVVASDDVDYFFMPGTGTVSRTAVAQATPGGCFDLGSYAAGLDSSNSALLNGILGNALHTGVLSYNGIATAQITLGELATELGFGTPEQLLSSNVDMDSFAVAAANVLQRNGDAASATFLASLPAQTPGPSPVVSFGSVVTTQSGSEDQALAVPFNVLDILTGMALVANGTNAIAVPQVNVTVPGVTNVQSSLTVVEKAQKACGGVGWSTPSNRQFSLRITAALPNATLDMTLALASGVGTITALDCGSPGTTPEMTIGVRSDLITVSGTVKSLVPSATLGIVAPAGQAQNSSVTFTGPLPPAQTGSTGTGDVGLSGTTLAGDPLLTATLQPVIDALALQLDQLLVNPLTDLVGINVAGADVTGESISCTLPKIVV
jgi:uncharacterized membrane protein